MIAKLTDDFTFTNEADKQLISLTWIFTLVQIFLGLRSSHSLFS
jgi:hypothetical protein